MYAVFNGEQHIMGSNLAKLEANLKGGFLRCATPSKHTTVLFGLGLLTERVSFHK